MKIGLVLILNSFTENCLALKGNRLMKHWKIEKLKTKSQKKIIRAV